MKEKNSKMVKIADFPRAAQNYRVLLEWGLRVVRMPTRAGARHCARAIIFEKYGPWAFHRTFSHVHSLPRSFDTHVYVST